MASKSSKQCSSQISPVYEPAKSFACGKAILVGEHAVVYGAQAIAMPVKHMGMSLDLIPDNDAKDLKFRIFLGGHEVSDQIVDLIPEAFRLLQLPPCALTINGSSSIPIGAGLGSSATLCVAILRVILASYGENRNPQSIANLANLMEARFHGNPSGLDTAVIANGSCIKFVKGSNPSGLELAAKVSGWRFVLIDSKIRAGTRAMIEKAAPFFAGKLGRERVELFNALALQAEYGLTHGSLGDLADAMNQTGVYLKEAGVVPQTLQDIISHCRGLGIPAAKTTGAGGGGTILCLLSPDRAEDQIKALAQTYPGENITITEIA